VLDIGSLSPEAGVFIDGGDLDEALPLRLKTVDVRHGWGHRE
jgi:hypothetical protein